MESQTLIDSSPHNGFAERDALADIQSSRRSPPMTYHSLSIFDFMSYAFSGPAAMNSQEKKLLTADLETEDGVNEFIEALKSLRPTIETGPSKEEFLDRIASLRPTVSRMRKLRSSTLQKLSTCPGASC